MLFSLGNTLGDYSTLLRDILGGIAFVLYLPLLTAFVKSFKNYRLALKNLLTASIFPTLLMQGMLMIVQNGMDLPRESSERFGGCLLLH